MKAGEEIQGKRTQFIPREDAEKKVGRNFGRTIPQRKLQRERGHPSRMTGPGTPTPYPTSRILNEEGATHLSAATETAHENYVKNRLQCAKLSPKHL
jgi:hypothetical protein